MKDSRHTSTRLPACPRQLLNRSEFFSAKPTFSWCLDFRTSVLYNAWSCTFPAWSAKRLFFCICFYCFQRCGWPRKMQDMRTKMHHIALGGPVRSADPCRSLSVPLDLKGRAAAPAGRLGLSPQLFHSGTGPATGGSVPHICWATAPQKKN